MDEKKNSKKNPRKNPKKNPKKSPKKKIIYYYVIVTIILVVINTFVMPSIVKSKIKEIDYGKFISMVEEGEVKSVTIADREITIEPNKKDDQNTYTTVRIQDPDLIKRLENADIERYKGERRVGKECRSRWSPYH